jgi:hypothetical protein
MNVTMESATGATRHTRALSSISEHAWAVAHAERIAAIAGSWPNNVLGALVNRFTLVLHC